MLIDHDIRGFIDELASKSPAPGGGSVAALAGALGAGLVSMVCRLTIGKKGYENVEDEIKEILRESESIREEFIKLIDLDAEAFNAIMSAFKLPKSTDEDTHIRTEAIQASTRKATLIPMRVIDLAVKALSLAQAAGTIANNRVMSDIGVAGSMLSAAVESAWFNVEINLNSIKDKKFFDEINDRGELLLDECEELYENVMEIADSIME